jgi:hypothetical protein
MLQIQDLDLILTSYNFAGESVLNLVLFSTNLVLNLVLQPFGLLTLVSNKLLAPKTCGGNVYYFRFLVA